MYNKRFDSCNTYKGVIWNCVEKTNFWDSESNVLNRIQFSTIQRLCLKLKSRHIDVVEQEFYYDIK